MHYAMLAGLMIAQFVLQVYPVSRLVWLENKKEPMMNDTYYPIFLNSLDSVILTHSLVNRLKERLSTVGSMIYKQTWKQKATPSGMPYWAHTASPPRIKDNDCFGWPTPAARDYKDTGDLSKSMVRKDGKTRLDTVPRVASIAGWPTPTKSLGGGQQQLSGCDREGAWNESCGRCEVGRVGDTNGDRPCQRCESATTSRYGCTPDSASGIDWLYCQDNKYRPIKSGLKPLVDGLARGMVYSGGEIDANNTAFARAQRLKGYGNAINADVATVFIRSFMDVIAY
jgi:hypothetical protein